MLFWWLVWIRPIRWRLQAWLVGVLSGTMKEMAQRNGSDRLDRMEKIVEGLLDAHILLERSQKNLLRSQVLLQDAQEQTIKQVDRLAQRVKELTESQQRTDKALRDLINYLRGRGPARN